MPELRDLNHPDLDDGVWATELELEAGDERPNSGLDADPRGRKWVLFGVGVAGLLTAAFVFATLGSREATASRSDAPSDPSAVASSPQPVVEQPSVVAAAEPDARERVAAELGESATLAAHAPAAVQPAVEQPASELAAPQAAAVPASKPVPPASAPTPSVPASTPAAPAPVTPAPVPVPIPEPAPSVPAPSADPDEPASANAAELPDVEGWDDADADAEHTDADDSAT